MGDLFAWLFGFLTRDIDRRSSRDWRLMLVMAAVLAGAGVVLWRIPDPAELVSRRVPAMVCLALGALFLAYAVFVYLRQRPATLPTDRIAIGIARLHPVGGGRASELAEVEADKLYRQLNARQKAGAPIQVRRVFASIPETETDEARAESARELGTQPNIRVHLVVWGDAVAEGPGRLYLNLAAAHPAPPAELGDASSEEYEALAAEYPDLPYADFILLRCGEALVAAKDDARALAITSPIQSVASAALRGGAHLRLSLHQPPEVCEDHLRRAIAEFERVTGANPDPATFRSYGTQRGRSEWTTCFGRMWATYRLTYDQDAAESVGILLHLIEAYRAALAQAEKSAPEACDALLDWWEGLARILGHVHSTDRALPMELVRESLTILEWIVRERARRGHAEHLLLASTKHFLRNTSYGVGAGCDESAIDVAERCIRDIAAATPPALAATLRDLATIDISHLRLSYEAAEQQRAQLQASIAVSERLLVNERVKNDLFIRKDVLFLLASSRSKLAFSYPAGGPDRRAELLASVGVWHTWSQVPSPCNIGMDSEIVYLGDAYLDIARDPSSPPGDAVQFAMLAQRIYETILAHASLGPKHFKRGVTHLGLSAACSVLAQYSLNGRESLLASAREHARKAADQGLDTTWTDTQIDRLSAQMAGARPLAASGA